MRWVAVGCGVRSLGAIAPGDCVVVNIIPFGKFTKKQKVAKE